MSSVTGIVIPCYNEENRLPMGEYREFFRKGSEGLQILFVNDGSTDRTQDRLDDLRNAFPSVVSVLSLEKNSGKAEAVRRGMLHLIGNTNSSFLGYWDADLSTPLDQIKHLESAIGKYGNPSMILGSRVKLHGSTKIERRAMRHYSGRIIGTVISKMLGIPVYDTQCGAKLIYRKDAQKIFEDAFISRWLFDVELLFRIIAIHGYGNISTRVVEIPLLKWTEKGNSKIPFTYLFKLPFELFMIRVRYRGKGEA